LNEGIKKINRTLEKMKNVSAVKSTTKDIMILTLWKLTFVQMVCKY